jgi:hypothetical protein
MGTQPTIADYDSALHTMLDENEALRAQLAEARSEIERLVEWINGDRDALVCLQSIYNNPSADKGTRIKAAAAAIGYERPKLTFSVQVSGPSVLGERLDQSRTVKTVNQPPPLIEHKPQ